MVGLYMQCEKARGSLKDRQKVNVLCIVDQDHQKSVVVVGPSRKVRGI